jgi:hypothetical protein
MRRSAVARVRWPVRRAVRRPLNDVGVDTLDIGQLISPLRYDVVLRADFFRFLDANLDLYRRNFTGFSQRAREEPYFIWFERVAVPRFRPWLAQKDRAVLLYHYDERLRRSHALWMSFLKSGFDSRHPVTLRRAHPAARTDSGLHIDRLVHPGDGCHRLALLLASGEPLLRPKRYRIDRRPLRAVLDNTNLLVRALDLDEQPYARFLSLRYADHQHNDLHSLIRDVHARRPAALDELRSVIRQHRSRECDRPRHATPRERFIAY